MKKFSTRLGSGLSFRFATLAFAALGLAFPAFADVPDLTESLVELGNPTLEKWSTPRDASTVMDLQAYDGKIFLGTGNYSANTGASQLWAYDTKTGSFTNEFSAGTEAIEIFRVLADGRMYVPATDPSGGANNGKMFRRELDGSWTVFREDGICYTHMYDTEMVDGKLFICGYRTAMSSDYGETWTRGDNTSYAERLSGFIRCGDEMFCKPVGSFNLNSSGLADGKADGSAWMHIMRWNGEVLEAWCTNTWQYVAPGISRSDMVLAYGSSDAAKLGGATVRFWHPTPFGNRNLYVIGDCFVERNGYIDIDTRPMMAASGYATDDGRGGRMLKADRINLPSGYWPIDFCVSGNTAFMLAFAYNSTDKNVRHGVWKTTDGVNFEQIFSFDYQQAMMSIEYLNGYFYFGVAYQTAMGIVGTLADGITEKAGTICRISAPQDTGTMKVSIAKGSDADEKTRTDGSFIISRSNDSPMNQPLLVRYSVSGGDAVEGRTYEKLSGIVAIPAYSNSVSVSVSPCYDAAIQQDSTVTLSISESADYTIETGSASIQVVDGGLMGVSVAVGDEIADYYSSKDGSFVFSRAAGDLTVYPMTITYSVDGTGVAGSSYTALSGTVTIPVGESSATVYVVPNNITADATVRVTITNTDYSIVTGTATVQLKATTSLASGATTKGVYDPETTTLTLCYDTYDYASLGKLVYSLTESKAGWVSAATNHPATKVVISPSMATFKPTTMKQWFMYFYSVTSIVGLNRLDTSEVTSMESLFTHCRALTSVDLSKFDTSKVTSMRGMFSCCFKLASLDLSKFNTANVTDMAEMFYNSKPSTLNFSSFNTEKVTTMKNMFAYNTYTSLDLSSFNTSNVTDMVNMFYRCTTPTITVSELWSTANVAADTVMFERNTTLVGGAGTVFTNAHVDVSYARIDHYPDATPGYFTPSFDITTSTITSVEVTDTMTNGAVIVVSGYYINGGTITLNIYQGGNLEKTVEVSDWGSVTVTGLTKDTAYTVSVTAKNGSGTSTTYSDVAFTTPAEGPIADRTEMLEDLGNPTGSSAFGSSVMDLQVYQGKIFIGTGDFTANTGATPVWAYDPSNDSFTNEFTAGTKAIEIIRVLSDGNLYIPATAPTGGENTGSLFRRDESGNWTVFPERRDICASHVYDVELCRDRLYLCGSNTLMSVDDGATWTSGQDSTWNSNYNNRYLQAMVRCGDNLFTHGEGPVATISGSGSISAKYVETMALFTNSVFTLSSHTKLSYIFPTFKLADTRLVVGDDATSASINYRFWHPTPFGNRNLYVIGDDYVSRAYTSPVAATSSYPAGTRPMIAVSGYAEEYSFMGTRYKLRNDRITLPDGYWPIDFCVNGDKAYMLAFSYNSADKNVRHGVWETTDGVNFTQILKFDYQQVMMSIEFLDGYFYFGVAHKDAMVALGELADGTEEMAGHIFRTSLELNPTPVVDTVPTISTVEVSNITTNGATVTVYGTDLDSGSITVEVLEGNIPVATVSDVSDWGDVSITGLSPSTTYTVSVTATNGESGRSATNTEVEFTTAAAIGGGEEEEGGEEEPVVVPDLTSKLEFVGNPTLEKWSTPIYASSVMDLQAYRGKIYVGTGDYAANSGPSPVWAYDPFAGAFTNEFTAGTEAIEIMRVLPDGNLYIPATDPAGGEHNGSLFRRDSVGNWTVFPEYNAYCSEHMYDIECCRSNLFVCGYGVMKSADYGETWSDATDANWADYKSKTRLYSMVRCGDALFCHPQNTLSFASDGTASNYAGTNSTQGAMRILRLLDDGTLQTAGFSKLNYAVPDIKPSDMYIVRGDDVTVTNAYYRFWHPTPFRNRNLYVVGDVYTTRIYTSPVAYSTPTTPTGTRPMMAASAYAVTNASGRVIMQADRINLPDGYYPIDFCVNCDTAYALAFAYNSTGKNVRHGVWKTTDGTNFTQVLSFDYQQVMMSMEYLDGYFYFGVTHKNAMIAVGELQSGTEETAGSIYRVRCPQETLSVVATAESATLNEGASQSINFTLSAAPTTNITLKVMARASQTITLDKTSLTFTPDNWSTAQSVNVTLVDDSVKDELKFHIICGANTDEIVHGECASSEVTPAVVAITPVDNDEEGGGEEESTAPTISSVTVSEIATNGLTVTVAGSGLESAGSVNVAIYDDAGTVAITNVTMYDWGSVTIVDLDPSTSYKVRVTASNGDKSTTADDVSATTTDVPVSADYWVLDVSGRTMTWGGWTLTTGYVDTNRREVDVRGPSVYPDTVSPLDFSLPVKDADGNSYTITSFNTCFKNDEVAASRVGELTMPTNGLVSTGYAAFYNCTNATGVLKFPSTYSTMGGDTFTNCKKLSIDGSTLSSLTSMGGGFSGVTFVGEVYIPLIDDIQGGIFSSCNVESVRFGPALKRLGRLTQWASGCFCNCTKLTNVVFDANSRVSIEYGETFYGCTSLRDIDLSVVTNITCDRFIYNDGANTNVNKGVFYKCSSLTNVTLGADLAFIASNTFENATALQTIRFKGLPPASLGLPYLAKVSNSQKVTTIVPGTLIATANASGKCWNDYATGGVVWKRSTIWASGNVESSVNLSMRPLVCEGYEEIGNHWIYDPATETITDNAWTFNATLNGTSLTVGTPLDDTTPSQCPTEITALDFSKPVVDGTNPSTTYTIVNLSPIFYNNSAKTQRASANYVGAFTLPGEGLTKIGAEAFTLCSNLSGDLVFPSSLTETGTAAFKGTKVTSADFKTATCTIRGNSGRGIFQQCTSLKWVRFAADGKFTFTSGYHFNGCTSLGDADLSGLISATVTKQDYANLCNCSALTNVTLNSSLWITNTTATPSTQGTIGNTLFRFNTKLATIRFTGAAPTELDSWIKNDGGYLGCLSSSQAITTIVSNEFAEVKNSNGKSWADYAAGALNATDSTFASSYLVDSTTPANRKLILVTAPASGYDAWVAEIVTGDDAAWDAKPSVWGGDWANAFIYTYGEGLTNDTEIMTISFDASGNPVITTPSVVEGHDDFTAVVIGTPDVKDWTSPITLEKNDNTWKLPSGKSANFFRVKLTNE